MKCSPGEKLLVSTTSVLPSHRPRESPFPLSDGFLQMRTSVERNDARLVDEFRDEHDVVGSLHDLVVAVRSGPVIAAESGCAERQAAAIVADVFGIGGIETNPRRRKSARALLPGRRLRRHLAIRWIDDERRPVVELTLDHVGRPGRRIRTLVPIDIAERREEDGVSARIIGVLLLEDSIGALFQLGDFLLREMRAPFERVRPFQRRGAVADPRFPAGRACCVWADREPRCRSVQS
jgi:hypothetical protein